MQNKLRIIFVVLAIATVPLFSGCGSSATQGYSVSLEMWGVFDDSTAYDSIIQQYKKINPYVKEIKYKKFAADTYRQELIDALASGKGPDIFLINNSWLPAFENKLQPAPTILLNEQLMKSNFPDVVVSDFMDNGKVYAVPLSVDSMQLYYNRDKFNAAGITAPPQTWKEFNDDVKKLTIIDSNGNIAQSAAAIGTAKNVNRASDLLATLMFQNGVEMPMQKGQSAKFDEGVSVAGGNTVQAGEQALGFYTQFSKLSANPSTSALYTWNARMRNSIDAFSDGSTAMMFNYSWQIPVIKSKNPKLNFAVAPIPQVNVTNPVTMANYWGYGVSLNKISPTTVAGKTVAPVSNDVRTHEAWQFLRFLSLKNNKSVTMINAITKNSKVFALNFDPALTYLTKNPQPAARRDLIDKQMTDALFGAFAAGNIYAKNWYQADPDSADKIFTETIESVVSGGSSVRDALTLAKNRINFLAR